MQPADDAIVFGREAIDPRTGASSQALFVTDPSGLALMQVTSPGAGVRDDGASWSPDGSRLVFTRNADGLSGELLIVDRSGARVSRLTSGRRDNHDPVWGPGSQIAFESAQSDPQPDCLRVIDLPSRHQRELFCATDSDADPTDIMAPTWSFDGASLYVATSHAVGRLGEAWWGDVYRVDVASGAATRLARASLNEQSSGVIAPDGRTAVFKRFFAEGVLTLLDLADGTQRSLGGGDTPVFSSDGRELAFVRTVVLGTWPDLLQLHQVFVAGADGAGVRQITGHRDPTLRLATLDWSADATQLLVQHWNEGDTRRQLAILDIATAQLRPLPQGVVSDDAWFDR